MRSLLLLLPLLATPALAKDKRVEKGAEHEPVDLTLAYRGAGDTGLQPGAAVRVTADLHRRDVFVDDLPRGRGFRHRSRDWFLGGELGMTSRVFSDVLVTVHGVAGTRKTRTSGLVTSPTLSFGPSRSVLAHPSWKTTDDGGARRTYLAGQWGLSGTLAYTVGWDLERRRETRIRKGVVDKGPALPLVFEVRTASTVVGPWNGSLAWTATLDLGVRFSSSRLRKGE